MVPRTKAEGEAIAKAHLIKMKEDPQFMSAGQGNDDTVNFAICCHVLGLNYHTEIGSYIKGKYGEPWRLSRWEEHIERVEPYLDSWGPTGREQEALDYMI